jgi:hypothetical protein
MHRDGDDWQDVSEVIPYIETRMNFGGTRRWLQCLNCGQACRVLYGRAPFRCRKCHGLHYESQYEPAFGRAASRVHKIRERLGHYGALVVILSPLPFIPQRWAIPNRVQCWLNPTADLAMGIVGGATVMLAPVIIYFVALRIEKNIFVSSMGAIALCSMMPLFIHLAANDVLGRSELLLSALALVPTMLGMAVGTWLRGRISQSTFNGLLGVSLLLLGLNLIRKGLADN